MVYGRRRCQNYVTHPQQVRIENLRQPKAILFRKLFGSGGDIVQTKAAACRLLYHLQQITFSIENKALFRPFASIAYQLSTEGRDRSYAQRTQRRRIVRTYWVQPLFGIVFDKLTFLRFKIARPIRVLLRLQKRQRIKIFF